MKQQYLLIGQDLPGDLAYRPAVTFLCQFLQAFEFRFGDAENDRVGQYILWVLVFFAWHEPKVEVHQIAVYCHYGGQYEFSGAPQVHFTMVKTGASSERLSRLKPGKMFSYTKIHLAVSWTDAKLQYFIWILKSLKLHLSIITMAKSVEDGFDKFLEKLQPLKSEHKRSVSHKGSVSKCLENNWARTMLFETGSFGNGTGVRGYSDTDYFAICPEEAFYANSASTLRRIKETLQGTFSQTPIEVRTPAVRISFGFHASEILEITPACYHKLVETPNGKRRSYYIPDYQGGWMVSCPTAHNTYVDKQNKRLDGRLKPLIRLVKAWKFFNEVPITSFYLELRVAKYAADRADVVYDRDVRNILKLLYDKQLANLQDPMRFSGYVAACKTPTKKQRALSKVATAYSRADKAYECKLSNISLAFEWWQKLYNYEFPAR